MNLYVFGLVADLSKEQKDLLDSKFTKVVFLSEDDYNLPITDN